MAVVGKFDVPLTKAALRDLDKLAKLGRFGPTPNEVAAYPVLRGLDDLVRAGVLKDAARGDEAE